MSTMINEHNPQQIAKQIQTELAQLGYCHEIKRLGIAVPIGFNHIFMSGNDWLVLEIDLATLPHRVTVDRLLSKTTKHHLGTTIGRPIYSLNTLGASLAIDLRSADARRNKITLPTRATLDLNSRPDEPYQVPIGVGPSGPIWRALPGLGHVLLGGATRTGKSLWLQMALLALLTAHSPDELKLALVDLKMVEFIMWPGLPHLLCPVALNLEHVDQVTGELMAEMERRQNLFAQVYARNLQSYNARADKPLPVILAVFDELADITLALGKSSQAYTDLTRLVQKGAGLGIFVWAGAQNPKSDILGTLARGQLTTRLAFRMNESHQSRVILERNGAERLPADVPGRMLARLPGTGNLVLCQGYYLDDDDMLTRAQKLTTTKPLTWGDLAGDQELVTADLVDHETARIRELHAQGLSKRQIQQEIFNYVGGAAYEAVNRALNGGTTTT